jgi:putative endonuclease
MVAQDGIIAVYMMASGKHGTLYIGVTSDLARRAWEHREGMIAGFTQKHGCKRLVWWKQFETIVAAIQSEKTMKHWVRGWKVDAIERDNPHWDDLYCSWLGAHPLPSPSGLTRGPIVSNGAENP